jgi:hypothetical protein
VQIVAVNVGFVGGGNVRGALFVRDSAINIPPELS